MENLFIDIEDWRTLESFLCLREVSQRELLTFDILHGKLERAPRGTGSLHLHSTILLRRLSIPRRRSTLKPPSPEQQLLN